MNVYNFVAKSLVPEHFEHLDDTALLAEVVRKREDALMMLYKRYVNRVFGLALYILRDPESAEEVTQDVFIKLWRHPLAWDPYKGDFSSWFLTVVRHAAIDSQRKQHRRTFPGIATALENCPATQEETVEQCDSHESLQHTLGQVPMEQRDFSAITDFAPTRTLTTEEIATAERCDGQWILYWSHQPDFRLADWELVPLETALRWTEEAKQ